jgi:hypothetical protein
LEEDLDLLLNIKDMEATACWGAPVFDTYSDSNEGLGDEGATARRAALALEIDS